jgi:hypothetical protein
MHFNFSVNFYTCPFQKKKKAQQRRNVNSQTKEILDELQQHRNVDNLLSENPLKYEGNLEFYTAEGQIRR